TSRRPDQPTGSQQTLLRKQGRIPQTAGRNNRVQKSASGARETAPPEPPRLRTRQTVARSPAGTAVISRRHRDARIPGSALRSDRPTATGLREDRASSEGQQRS